MLRTGSLVILTCLAISKEAPAQELRWRHDYSAARKESAATGKPMLLDFGTEACTWCKKLDATTFRNPAIVAQLNERFIPIKIDAEREAKLTEAVQIDSFPTLLLVSSDGKILSRHVGYADTHQMAGFLAKAPAGAPAPSQAPLALSPAAALLKAARSEHDAGHYLRCVEVCDQLQTHFPSTPECSTARELAASISADPSKWKHLTTQLETDLIGLRGQLDPAR